jgi:uncharacterized protein (DUF2236 family)
MDDEGLFGPGSVTWRVHASPAMLIGGMRALIIQSLHPLAMAGVFQHSDFRARPMGRLRRTAEYVATTTFGDTATAQATGAQVRRIHGYIRGTDPVTGKTYSASDTDTLLWVHCVEWHSFLAGYKAYGGRISERDQDRYLAESARAAELVGIDPAAVPASRAEMREYFDAMLPSLCVSQAALEAIDFVVSPPMTRDVLPYAAPLRVSAAAAITLVPRHLRRLAGLQRPWAADALTRATVGAAVGTLALALKVPVGGAAVRRATIARIAA